MLDAGCSGIVWCRIKEAVNNVKKGMQWRSRGGTGTVHKLQGHHTQIVGGSF